MTRRELGCAVQALVLGTGLFLALLCMAAASSQGFVFRYQGF